MSRASARELAQKHLAAGDALGWFDVLYQTSDGQPEEIPWADMAANPNLTEWFEQSPFRRRGTALVVGAGLGDDAEYLAQLGFGVTAFDISKTAVAWCKTRFEQSPVQYSVADLFHLPVAWKRAFDFVFEAYTLQVLPPELREKAVGALSECVTPGGRLLVITRGREPEEDQGQMPWPLTRGELEQFDDCGLEAVRFEDYFDSEQPPVRRFRAEFTRTGP